MEILHNDSREWQSRKRDVRALLEAHRELPAAGGAGAA